MKSVLGVSMDKEVAEFFGINQASVTNWRKRGTIPVEQCIQMAARKGVTLDWLIMGEGGDSVRESGYSYLADPEYTEVPLYDIEASAGHGSLFEHERIESHLKFRNDWLARERLDKANLVAIRVTGDSMDGTLSDGDTVLIDRSRTKPDGVFAIRIGDGLRIKRLQKMTDGSLRVSSDNPMYQPEVIHPENMEQVEVVGQCYWRGGRVF
jgi:phage repressor protein C with HTH and peptisase S24 domain